MQYTETQLTKLIADVEKEFNAHLAKAEDVTEVPLAKAENGDKPEKKPEEKKPEAKEAKPAEGEAPAAEAKPAEGEKPAPAPAEGAPAGMAAAAPADHDYDAEDVAHLEKMYMSMSEPELKLHHDTIKKCAMGKCGDMAPAAPGTEQTAAQPQPDVQKSELNAHGESENPPQPKVKGKNLDGDPKNGGIEGQEPNNSPGAKSAASDTNGAKINKSEHARRNGGKIEGQEPSGSPGEKSPATKDQRNLTNMEKSEQNQEVELLKSELEATKTQFTDLKKNFDAVQEFLTKLVKKTSAPPQKAVTSLEVIAKSENTNEGELSKPEIDAKLLRKSQDPATTKADRDAINAFYLSGESIKSISHLLK